jgi:hypothetical protein
MGPGPRTPLEAETASPSPSSVTGVHEHSRMRLAALLVCFVGLRVLRLFAPPKPFPRHNPDDSVFSASFQAGGLRVL